MSKKLLTSYTFDASAQTIVSADFTSLEKIQLITNVTDQLVIYNFADTTKGGTLSGTTLTLEYDTTSMDDTDKLQIFVEDAAQTVPSTQSGTWNITNISGTVSLPTGASTSAKQDTIIGHVDGIEGLLTTIDADTSNISTKIDTIAGAVSGTEVQVDVLTMPTTTVQATNLDIRDLTSASDSVAAVQSGTWNVTNISGTVSLPTGAATSTKQSDGSQKTQIVDGSGNVIGATSNALDVNIKSGSSSGTEYTEGDIDASITGSAILWEDTSDTLRAVSAAKPLPVDVKNSSIAITNASLTTLAGAVSGTEMQVDVLTMPTTTVQATNLDIRDLTSASDSIEVKQATGTNLHAVIDSGTITTITNAVTVNSHAVTNAGTFAVQVDGSALTSLQLIDDAVYTDGSGTVTKGIAILGQDGTNPQAIKTDTSGELQVDVLTMPTVAVTQSGTWDEVGINDSGNSITVDNPQLSVVGSGTEATAMRVTIATDSTGVLSVDDNGGNLSIDDGGNSITVDYATTGSGTATGALRVELPTNGTGVIATVGAVTAITNALPAGTNAIGKLAANSGVDIGDVDVTSLPALAAGTNAIGKLLPPDVDVTAHTNYAKKYYTNAGAVTDGIIWSPAAGKRWHIVSMIINVSADATITLEDDKAGGDEVVWKGEIAAKSGFPVYFGEKYPLASGEDAADLLITTSAGNIYVTCVGYEV